MAFKFNQITFDLKDLLLVIGLVAGYFNFKSEQNERFAELKKEIAQIISDNKLQEVKVNARFEGMLNKPTSEKQTENKMIRFVAICNYNRLQVVKKKLLKSKLV